MKLLALTLGLLPLMAMAGQTINEQIDIPANKRIFIENQRGDVRIEGWDKPVLKIEGELDDKARRLSFRCGRKPRRSLLSKCHVI